MKKTFTLLTIVLLIGWTAKVNAQAYTFSPGQLTYTESFDGMGAAGTNFINGWTAIRYAGTGSLGDVLPLVVTDGSSNAGAIYNVGSTGADDRAFGSLASGSTVPRFGAVFQNNTGSGITAIELTGVMEQWRSGSSNTVNEIFPFEYSLDAISLSTGTWFAASSFDLLEKITTSVAAEPLDGNLADNQTAISATITGISWTSGSALWIRWSDANDLGSDGILSVDNLVMTVITGTVTADPEPSNYPTAFSASSSGTSITTTWVDATGTQLPAGYLVKISTNSSIGSPVDGTFEADDLDFSDGNGAKNVLFGQQNYVFAGLAQGTAYSIKIFPYTNGGTLVDYKTDGTIPSATANTQTIILSGKFDTDLSPWTEFSVAGTQIWMPDLTHGVNGSGCAKMSGYEGGASFDNQDWLISPAMDFTHFTNTKFQFYSAYNYTGDPLAVLVSTDYTSGDPSTNGTWNDLTASAVFSPGGWAWTPSGYISLGLADVANVHIAFKYTSNATESRTWEIDEVIVAGNSGVGIGENDKANYTTRIYPNPCYAMFNAEMPGNTKFVITITNLQGLLLKTVNADAKTIKIETAGMASGLYFVTLTNTKSGLKEVHKLLVR
jgi:trimeric autotransporter adhesin